MMKKPFEYMEYYKPAEQLVKILIQKTQSNDPLFFRVQVAYHLTKIASMMHTSIVTLDRGEIPISLYALNLAPSGYGKGLSTNIIEDKVISRFKTKFMSETFNLVATDSINKLATARAVKHSTDIGQEIANIEREYNNTGAMVFSFDSATAPAIKQIRHKILMSSIGALCLEMDEVGANFSNNTDALNTFIELYDVGKIKSKITLNTNESKRREEIDGRTPTNMLLYGTPAKLLDGGKTEQEFFSMLEMGYARRCLFGYATDTTKATAAMTAEELYDNMTDTTSILYLDTLSVKLEHLADITHYNTKLTMSKEVTLELLEYQIYCNILAEQLAEHEEVKKAELSHRYFRALKLSGTYAFIDNSDEITMDHLYAAIKLLEDSGKAFQQILTREKPYVKLAKYIASTTTELTQVDLMDDLPFYKGSAAARADMMNLAIAYGYKNNIIIKKSYIDGIEFLKGESLRETDINKISFAFSADITTGFQPKTAPFNRLHELTSINGYHYTAHHFKSGYRSSENVIEGFNLVILDVDKDCSLDVAKSLLEDYMYLIATTKRHTEVNNRFRILLPLSHTIKLSAKDYAQFMTNLFDWLPFSVDIATKDIARKWETFAGEYFYNKGELLDAMLFIPQTKKSDDQKKTIAEISSMTSLERWFVNNTGEGNRSNMILKYALALVDNHYNIEQVQAAVYAFNGKLPEPLSESELASTIMLTVAKKIASKEN